MKKKVITMSLLFFYSFSYGQEEIEKFEIKKGSWILGGNVNYSYDKNTSGTSSSTEIKETKGTSFEIVPEIGYAVSKNLIIGLEMSYGGSKPDVPEFENPETTFFGISPFVTKYYPVNQKLAISLQTKMIFLKGEIDQKYSSRDYSSFSIGIQPGLIYSLGKRISFKTTLGFLGYVSTKSKDTYEYLFSSPEIRETENSKFNFNFGLSSLTFGVVFII